ncbi:hypothetical protein CVU37_12340 [candidate division BRC1 bacterium HGW-BRC1-1]|jgi:hypothetical protein|nr:MAG: hypothetical protein CVU37_12340 [candidate division BRC1 bacterium HGW-BRC1-1]
MISFSLRRVLWVGLVLLASLPVASAAVWEGVRIEPTEPSRFRFARSPQVAIFAPGNFGSLSFCDPPQWGSLSQAMLSEWACDGMVVSFLEENYAFSPVVDISTSHTRVAYWAKIREIAGASAASLSIVDFRVTSHLLDELETSASQSVGEFATRLAEAWDGVPAPLVSVDAEPDDPRATQLVAQLRERIPVLLVGAVVGDGESLPLPGDWDFFIARTESAPSPYSGPAATAWLRSQAGGRPVVVLSERPDFRAGLFQMAAGAAGLQFDSLHPPVKPDANALRSLSNFRWRMGAGVPPRFYDGLLSPGVSAVLTGGNRLVYFLQPSASAVRIRIPEIPDLPGFIGSWYDPEKDEHLIFPPQPIAGREELVSPPDDSPWVYAVDLTQRISDDATTSPSVEEFEPEF